jgi:hypothetical protein
MSVEDETWDKDPKYWEKDCRRNPYSKCRKCDKLLGLSEENKDDYHDKSYCLKYSYEEYLNFKNMCYGSEMGPYTPIEYIPEIWQVKKDTIYSVIDSLKLGLEYAEECLITHDNNLGRTIPRNKREAECIEAHITQIKESIKELKGQ